MTRMTCEQCGLPFAGRQKLWSHLGPRQYWGVRPCETILRIRADCLPDAPAPRSPVSSSSSSPTSSSSSSGSMSVRSMSAGRSPPATAEVAAHMIWGQIAARQSFERGKVCYQ